MTPLEIEILIHYRCCDDDFPRPSQAATEACRSFVKLGLLDELDTEKETYRGNLVALAIYVDALCRVPLPNKVWGYRKGEVL